MEEYRQRAEIDYTSIDHDDEGQSLPEENKSVLWWFKGAGSAPYCGTMLDDDFPGFEYFFCWSVIPEPPIVFFKKHNPEF